MRRNVRISETDVRLDKLLLVVDKGRYFLAQTSSSLDELSREDGHEFAQVLMEVRDGHLLLSDEELSPNAEFKFILSGD